MFGLTWFATGLNVVTAIGAFFVPESPRWLYGINNLERCKQVFIQIARFNGVKNYQPPQFDVDYLIYVEDVDAKSTSTGNEISLDKERLSDPNNTNSQSNVDGNNSQFDHLLGNSQHQNRQKTNQPGTMRNSSGRYLTAFWDGKEPVRISKRESIAYMHETVTNIRDSAANWIIGVDRTQSIAIDELFSKKPVIDGKERTTVTFRKSDAKKLSEKKLTLAGAEEDKEDRMTVHTTVMTRPGLCSGKTPLNLIFMIVIWISTLVSYNMIHIYLKYIPGTIYANLCCAGVAEITAHVVVGATFQKLTPKWTLFIGFIIGAGGGTCLIFQDKFEDHALLMAVFVLICQYGLSMSMCACYVSTPFIFPQ